MSPDDFMLVAAFRILDAMTSCPWAQVVAALKKFGMG